MMAASYSELFALLEKLEGELEKLTELQKEKTAAVLRDDLMGVNDCMKREQVISLTLRSMDQKREKLLTALGLGNIPLSALPSKCPAEHRARAREVARDVRERYMVFRSAADVARNTLEINLHQIQKHIRAEDAAPREHGGLADIRA